MAEPTAAASVGVDPEMDRPENHNHQQDEREDPQHAERCFTK